MRELGTLLYYALFSDEARGLLIATQRSVPGGDALRLVLRVDPPELAVLPWEFLFDPGQEDYLCLSMPVIRWPRVLHPVSRVQVEPPLRVLAMATRPADLEELVALGILTGLPAEPFGGRYVLERETGKVASSTGHEPRRLRHSKVREEFLSGKK